MGSHDWNCVALMGSNKRNQRFSSVSLKHDICNLLISDLNIIILYGLSINSPSERYTEPLRSTTSD